MSAYKGCRIPEDLLYDVEYHVWVKMESGTATVGATQPAAAYAGEVIYIKVKDVGTRVERGAIVATIESAKYMGPMRAPLGGTVTEVNQDVKSSPALLNKDPYANWVLKMAPERPDEETKLLTGGKEAAERYRPIIDEWGVECGGG
ncbi:MAG: glycine cleavage system protein H [Nitrososphaerota archaeon]|nr:glycine cleavage system protein H [Nitrososphaerota archaeon]